MQSFGNLNIHCVNYKNSKLFVIGNQLFCYITIKETSKGWVCDNFPRQFFFLDVIHEKHKFKYLMNLTVKVYKSWCDDIYISILQCENCSTGNFLIRFLIPMWSSGHPLFFAVFTVLHVIIYKQDFQICQIFHIYSTTTLSSVLTPKYSLLIRNKCAYLLESSETSITIWRQ